MTILSFCLVQYGYSDFLCFTENAGINELLFEAHVCIEGNCHCIIIITATEYYLCMFSLMAID